MGWSVFFILFFWHSQSRSGLRIEKKWNKKTYQNTNFDVGACWRSYHHALSNRISMKPLKSKPSTVQALKNQPSTRCAKKMFISFLHCGTLNHCLLCCSTYFDMLSAFWPLDGQMGYTRKSIAFDKKTDPPQNYIIVGHSLS